jgi:hypothetical protein
MSSKKKAKVRKLVGGGVGERLDAAERMAQMLLGLRQGGDGHGLAASVAVNSRRSGTCASIGEEGQPHAAGAASSCFRDGSIGQIERLL